MDRADWIRGRGNPATERALRREFETDGPTRARRILARHTHPARLSR